MLLLILPILLLVVHHMITHSTLKLWARVGPRYTTEQKIIVLMFIALGVFFAWASHSSSGTHEYIIVPRTN